MSETPRGEALLLSLLNGFIESKVVMTAHRLGLLSLLASETLETDEVLRRLELPPRSGQILINACRTLGLLELGAHGKLQTPADLVEFVALGPDQPFRVTTYLIDYYDEVYRALVDMDELVRTDGETSPFTLRDYFKEDTSEVDPEVARQYVPYMNATMARIVDVVLKTYAFAEHEHLLDLCGCAGYFCRAVVKATPGLRGSFLDVPACVQLYEDDPETAGRVTPIGGDIFKTELPEADVITMCRSAMDWGDEAIEGIYQKVYERLPVGGKLLIIERMFPEEFSAASRSMHLRSVYFLAKSQTTRYRKASEHRALLTRAGFSQIESLQPAEDPYKFFANMGILAATRT